MNYISVIFRLYKVIQRGGLDLRAWAQSGTDSALIKPVNIKVTLCVCDCTVAPCQRGHGAGDDVRGRPRSQRLAAIAVVTGAENRGRGWREFAGVVMM